MLKLEKSVRPCDQNEVSSLATRIVNQNCVSSFMIRIEYQALWQERSIRPGNKRGKSNLVIRMENQSSWPEMKIRPCEQRGWWSLVTCNQSRIKSLSISCYKRIKEFFKNFPNERNIHLHNKWPLACSVQLVVPIVPTKNAWKEKRDPGG